MYRKTSFLYGICVQLQYNPTKPYNERTIRKMTSAYSLNVLITVYHCLSLHAGAWKCELNSRGQVQKSMMRIIVFLSL